MNPNSRDQFSDFANFQPTYTDLTPQPKSGQVEDSIVNLPYINSAQNTSIHSPNQYFGSPTMVVQSSQPHQTLHSAPVNMTIDSSIAHRSSADQVLPITFFYQPPNDFCSYRITAKEISLAIATQLLNEFNGNINFHQSLLSARK